MTARLALLTAAVLVLLADGASAATLRVVHPHPTSDLLVYRAGPGVANRVTIERLGTWENPRQTVLVRDTAEPVLVRDRSCRRIDRHTARCHPPSDAIELILGSRADRATVEPRSVSYPVVHAGGGNDVVRAGPTGVLRGGRGADALRGEFLYGGAGSDRLYARSGPDEWGENTLEGGAGDDHLWGFGGNDDLDGGPGRDRLFGGRDDDTLVDGETDEHRTRDIFDGGPGRDTVVYHRRYLAVRLDLGAVLLDGQDTAHDIEAAGGGYGDDELIGDARPNGLRGGPGSDRIRGLGGDDDLHGGRGRDAVEGGEGDDWLDGAKGSDHIRAGTGDDFVLGADTDNGDPWPRGQYYPFTADELDCGEGADLILADAVDSASGCERAQDAEGKLEVVTEPSVRPGEAVFFVACDAFSAWRGCAVTITLRGGRTGTAFGTATGDFRAREGQDGPYGGDLAVPLNDEGREAFRGGALVQVDLEPVKPARHRELPWGTGYRLFMQGNAGE